ncbi:MAG: tRNA preQ1(34) S-adenosylmethionine ribosyltransferase-isomerase QueA [Vicinamibacterales bacterium]
MNVSDFDFELPPELIAQAPPARRGESRLLVLDRRTGSVQHTRFASLPDFLRADDLLVFNDTRVFPARLLGHRTPSGGAVECLLLERVDADIWDALVHPGTKLKPGTRFRCEGAGGSLLGEVMSQHLFGRRRVRLSLERGASIMTVIEQIGHVPLPPYIHRDDVTEDRERYQTVYARATGSIAAPTAGLHFSSEMLDGLGARGIERTAVTLHVGYGTFKPVRVDRVEDHRVDPEHYEVSADASARINEARHAGRRVVAVGTTTTRALESAAAGGTVQPGPSVATTFIHPGFEFRVVDALLTNFHVPRSSLLMLVCAFATREFVLAAYRDAVALGYRFYSYGDAMLIQ